MCCIKDFISVERIGQIFVFSPKYECIKCRGQTEIKFNIGNADRVIWDLTKIEAYKNYVAGFTSSVIVIPPLAPYQIQCGY